ncbi:hypothetical protein GX51_00818 [Blastomyces parvus]|uniref:Uncharacterized protein n=1 Tax=Blastomyces parvus TaxID=2060905 RepID=A0A2B7XJF5_9EURO|nr:hypothetical protein GX51_00818 [Blastomyces parvus]
MSAWWLPLSRQLEQISPRSGDVSDQDPFAQSPQEIDEISDNEDKGSAELQAINHICDILDIPMLPAAPGARHCYSPVFLGPGSMEEKVSVKPSQSMIDFLGNRFDVDATWRVYGGFGH